jgi:hypothetical protein
VSDIKKRIAIPLTSTKLPSLQECLALCQQKIATRGKKPRRSKTLCGRDHGACQGLHDSNRLRHGLVPIFASSGNMRQAVAEGLLSS